MSFIILGLANFETMFSKLQFFSPLQVGFNTCFFCHFVIYTLEKKTHLCVNILVMVIIEPHTD